MNDLFIGETEKKAQRDFAMKLRAYTNGKSACVITFGCQQNEADSERISGMLCECGYTITAEKEKADLIIINTCAIREHAEIRALSEAGQFKSMKEQNKELLIGLCGCMAQEAHRREQIYKSYPYVDFVFGTDMLHRVPEIVSRAAESRRRLSFVTEKAHSEFGVICEDLPVRRESGYKAWVPVMYGCDNFCTYCVVPRVRGRERSRNEKAVLDEVEGLVGNGYKDITLLGQNVNSYSGGCDFAKLITKASSFGGEYRVRFMTSHPKDASHELIDAIAENQNIAKHFHLPVQSGSNRILGLMNRRYTRELYLEKALEIKEKIKGVSLTTDIICGFPTETDEDFEQTLDLVKAVGFDMIFTFIFSPRKGTVAEKMDGQIDKETKNARFAALSALENDIAQGINNGYIGKTLRVLSDGTGKNGKFCGRSDGNKIVLLDKEIKAGVFCNAEIEGAGNYALSGKVTE